MSFQNNKDITVLMVGSTPPPYHGSNIYFRNLLDAMAEGSGMIIPIHVDTSDKRDDLKNLGRFDFHNVLAALRSSIRLIRNCILHKVDVIYIPISQNSAGFMRDTLLIVTGRLFSRAKIILHLHGGYFGEFYRTGGVIIKLIIEFSMKLSAGVIVLGERITSDFRQWFSKERLFVLPNFADDCSHTRLKIKKRPFAIGYLGNLPESKGIFDALEAVTILKKKNKKEVQLIVAGQFSDDPFAGSTAQDVEKRFREYQLSLGDNVRYIGRINPMERDLFFESIDVLVFPTWYRYEGLPLVILEAMAAGRPVISTRLVGVIDEVVQNGRTGFLVEERNPGELAEAIEMLMCDTALLIEMSNNSRKRYEKHFTKEAHLRSFERIILKVIKD